MSESSPPPSAPQPFADQPTRPASGGCGKPLLVGCGILVVLLGVGAIVFLLRAKEILVWSLGKAKDSVISNAAPEVTPEDRERLDAAFLAATRRLRSGEVDPAALQSLQGELMQAVQGGGRVSREQFLDLVRALERVGGVTPAGGQEEEAEGAAAQAPPSSP